MRRQDIHRLDLLEVRHVGRRRVRIEDALDRELDVIGGKVGAIVELHARSQVEDVSLRVGLFPRLGQVGHDIAVAVDVHQAVVGQVADSQRQQRDNAMNVEGGRERLL